MRYGSVCSGIEAASVAWEPLGWKPAFFAEIDKFPSAVLKHHYPTVPNAGDFTAIGENDYGAIDLLVGGTPCQSFSVAGKRGGLSDERGNLALEYIKLAYRSRPEFIVWENVPGVFSSGGGADFRCFLHGLTGVDVSVPQKGWKNSGLIVGLPGHYSLAWRVLDAQFAGVPQRRRRVFVVGHLGDWRRAAAVLLERESLLWNPAPRRETRQSVAGGVEVGPSGGRLTDISPLGSHRLSTHPSETSSDSKISTHSTVQVCSSTGEIAHCLNAGGMGRQDFETETLLAVGSGGSSRSYVAYGIDEEQNAHADLMGCLKSREKGGGFEGAVSVDMAVRRLTPIECERLQGFPDNYTLVPFRNKPAADGPRYKAIGNSMAVPVMRWIGERIQMVEGI